MWFKKSIEKVREKYQAELLKKKGVVALGIGHKITKGKDTGKDAIVVVVERKLPVTTLLAEEKVPSKIEGILTDVIDAGGEILPMSEHRIRRRPVIGGISGKVSGGTACSIGLIAFKDGKPVALTNEHCVMYPSGQNNVGKKFIQPSPIDTGTIKDTIGTIIYPPIIRNDQRNKIDSNIVPLDESISYDLAVLGLESYPKKWIKPTVGMKFIKIARTTGKTLGIISHINALAKVNYGGNLGVCEFYPCIFALQNNYNIVAGGDSVSEDTRLYWKQADNLHFGTIKELFDKFKESRDISVLSLDSNKIPRIKDAGITWNKVENVLHHGYKDVYQLTARDGKRIEITKDHSLFCLNKYQYDSKFKTETLFNLPNVISVTKEIDGEKNKIDKNIIAFLGLWIGDGCWIKNNEKIVFKDNKISIPKRKHKEGETIVRIKGVCISTGHNKKIVDFIQNFGNFKHKSKGDYRMWDINFVKKLEKLGFETEWNCYSKRVPRWLFTADKESKCAFLKGYFSADGCLSEGKRPIHIQLASVNRKLLEDTQILLSSLDIRSNLDTGSFNKTFSDKRQYKIRIECRSSVKKFKEKIGFLGEKIPEITGNPRGEERELFSRKIRDIEYIGKKLVYDLKVNPSESFVANGILCHNSGSVIVNSEGVIGQTFAAAPNLAIFLVGEVVGQELGIELEKPIEGYIALGDWLSFNGLEIITKFNVHLRKDFGLTGTSIRVLPIGTKVKILEGSGIKDNYIWLRVKV